MAPPSGWESNCRREQTALPSGLESHCKRDQTVLPSGLESHCRRSITQSWTSSIITITVFNVIWLFRNHSNMLILALKKHFQTFLKQVKIKKMNAMFFLIFALILSTDPIYILKYLKNNMFLMCFIFLHYIFSFCSLFVLYKQSLFLTSYTASEIASLHFFVYLICS